MKKYKKKDLSFDAVLYDGSNKEEVLAFLGESGKVADGVLKAEIRGKERTITEGTYIINGIIGLTPMKKEVFEKLYEEDKK